MAESLCRRSSGSKNKELDDAFIAWDELCKLQAKHRFRDMRLGCRVVYINLDRDTHRRENFERCAQEAHVKVCRMPGVDGSTHNFTEAEIALFEKVSCFHVYQFPFFVDFTFNILNGMISTIN